MDLSYSSGPCFSLFFFFYKTEVCNICELLCQSKNKKKAHNSGNFSKKKKHNLDREGIKQLTKAFQYLVSNRESKRKKYLVCLLALKYGRRPMTDAALCACVHVCARYSMSIYNSATISFIISSTAISFPCTRSQP